MLMMKSEGIPHWSFPSICESAEVLDTDASVKEVLGKKAGGKHSVIEEAVWTQQKKDSNLITRWS